MSLKVQKIVGLDAGLFEDGSKGPFGYVAGVIGNSGVVIGLVVVPDLVTSGSLTVEGETEGLEAPGDFSVTKTRQPSHFTR